MTLVKNEWKVLEANEMNRFESILSNVALCTKYRTRGKKTSCPRVQSRTHKKELASISLPSARTRTLIKYSSFVAHAGPRISLSTHNTVFEYEFPPEFYRHVGRRIPSRNKLDVFEAYLAAKHAVHFFIRPLSNLILCEGHFL